MLTDSFIIAVALVALNQFGAVQGFLDRGCLLDAGVRWYRSERSAEVVADEFGWVYDAGVDYAEFNPPVLCVGFVVVAWVQGMRFTEAFYSEKIGGHTSVDQVVGDRLSSAF